MAHREKDFSAQQPPPQADPRFPGADAHPSRSGGDLPAAAEGAPSPERLSSPARRGERLSADERLRRRADYLRCYRTGRRRHGPLAILYFVPNQLGHPRLGITASRKVGKAVARQRLKRRIKEVYRRWDRRDELPAMDLVVHLKPGVGTADFPTVREEVVRLLTGVVPREPVR